MNENEWWDNWCNVWFAIGWRTLAGRSNYNVDDVLDMLASILVRLRRLEMRDSRSLAGLFGIL